jgi:dihydroorotate dehydrogenase (NAD+) catalytic subunit
VNTLLGLLIDADTADRSSAGWRRACPGPAIKPSRCARCTTSRARSPAYPVIGTGGVMTGTDAVEMLLAGATAVGVGTANFLDRARRTACLDELVDWCAAHDVARVQDLVGAMEDA